MTVYALLVGKKVTNVYDGREDGSILIRLQDQTEIIITSGIIRQETEIVIKPKNQS